MDAYLFARRDLLYPTQPLRGAEEAPPAEAPEKGLPLITTTALVLLVGYLLHKQDK